MRIGISLLQEDRERSRDVRDGAERAGATRVTLHERDIRERRILLGVLDERARGLPDALRPRIAGYERAGGNRHGAREQQLAGSIERLLLAREQPVERA